MATAILGMYMSLRKGLFWLLRMHIYIYIYIYIDWETSEIFDSYVIILYIIVNISLHSGRLIIMINEVIK